TILGDKADGTTVRAPDEHVFRATHARRILRDRVQYRLYIRRRAGDDAQDFTRRSLLFQRFFQFLKQPHVLDGDHRLVGESFKELNLRRREGAYLDAARGQRSNDFSLLTQGNQQEGTRPAEDTQHWKIILRLSVRDMQRAMLDYPAKSRFINTDLFVGKTYGYRAEPRPRNEIVPVAKSQPQ